MFGKYHDDSRFGEYSCINYLNPAEIVDFGSLKNESIFEQGKSPDDWEENPKLGNIYASELKFSHVWID